MTTTTEPVRHYFRPTVTLTEQPDGRYAVAVDWLDSWESSAAPGAHPLRGLDSDDPRVTAACAALDAVVRSDPRAPLPADLARPVIEWARVNDPACADYVICADACGNDVNTGAGFWPASTAGLSSPDKDSAWDGTTIACLDCGRVIDTAPSAARPEPADTWTPWRSPVVGRITLPDLSTEPRPGE